MHHLTNSTNTTVYNETTEITQNQTDLVWMVALSGVTAILFIVISSFSLMILSKYLLIYNYNSIYMSNYKI